MFNNATKLYTIIDLPVLTEKSYKLQAEGRYAFYVNENASKKSIAMAVAKLYNVDVLSVNLLNKKLLISPSMRGYKKISGYKKAYVKIKKGQVINVEEIK